MLHALYYLLLWNEWPFIIYLYCVTGTHARSEMYWYILLEAAVMFPSVHALVHFLFCYGMMLITAIYLLRSPLLLITIYIQEAEADPPAALAEAEAGGAATEDRTAAWAAATAAAEAEGAGDTTT